MDCKICHVKNIPRLEKHQSFVWAKGVIIKIGCGFYIRNGIKYKQINDLDIRYYDDNNEFQSSWIEIIKENKPNIIARVFYRYPKKTSDNIFNDKLDQTLKRISKEKKMNIVCGDFNYNFLNREYNIYISDFIDIMYSQLFQPCIIEPTRIIKKINHLLLIIYLLTLPLKK